MKCPVCKDVTLLMTEKKGIEVDYCPECRGIWLDRGELEKLIEKEISYNDEYYERKTSLKAENNYDNDYAQEEKHKENKYYNDKYYDKKKHSRKRKKESFLEDIFDIFGD